MGTEEATVGPSANKVKTKDFWITHDITHIDYFQKGSTMNNDYYADLLDRITDDLKKK